MITGYRKSAGYTLLELILALALSVIVLVTIGMAIQLYMVALTKQQALIERKQVARSVLEMIANDLRAGIQYKAADYSDLENLVQSQLLAMGSMAGATSEGESGDEAPIEDPIVDEAAVSFRPTMLGNQNLILLDISRLPRVDQYNPLVAIAETAVQTPSDVKSLTYFVSLTEGGAQEQVQFSEPVAPGGLYRREIDRAVAAYNGDTGLIEQPDQFSHLVASEIAQIQFRYFDGSDWQTEWDSVEQGGFPPAIEITLVLDPARASAGTAYSYTGYDSQSMETYRAVVHLPAVEPPPDTEGGSP